MISSDVLNLLLCDTACAVYSRHGTILRANGKFGRLLNLPPEKLRGKNLGELIVGLGDKDLGSYLAGFPVGTAVEETIVLQGGDIRQRPLTTLTVPFQTGQEVHYLLCVRPLQRRFENGHPPPVSRVKDRRDDSLPHENIDPSGPTSDPT